MGSHDSAQSKRRVPWWLWLSLSLLLVNLCCLGGVAEMAIRSIARDRIPTGLVVLPTLDYHDRPNLSFAPLDKDIIQEVISDTQLIRQTPRPETSPAAPIAVLPPPRAYQKATPVAIELKPQLPEAVAVILTLAPTATPPPTREEAPTATATPLPPVADDPTPVPPTAAVPTSQPTQAALPTVAPLINTPTPIVNTPTPVINTPTPLVNTPTPLIPTPTAVMNTPVNTSTPAPTREATRFLPSPTPLPTVTPVPPTAVPTLPLPTPTLTPWPTLPPLPTATPTPPLTVAFAKTLFTVNEGEVEASLEVVLSGPAVQPVQVTYRLVAETATEGADYQPQTGVLTFLPAQRQALFMVTIHEDNFDEPHETLQLQLSQPQGAILGLPITATLMIMDNDAAPIVQFNPTHYVALEAAKTVTLTATLDHPSAFTVTANYQTVTGTAFMGQDYVGATGVLTFAPGQLSQTLTLTLIDDSFVELPETFWVYLTSPLLARGRPAAIYLPLISRQAGQVSPGRATQPLTSTSVAEITLMSDDLPAVQWTLDRYFVNEAETTALFTVTLNAPVALTTTVQGVSVAQTAQAGEDYLPLTQTLVFAPLQTQQAVTLTIIPDKLNELNETLTLVLTQPLGLQLADPYTATLTIIDNDSKPIVQWSSPTYAVVEGAGMAIVTVTLNTPSALPVTVSYQTSDLSAQAGRDYDALSGTLTILPGQLNQTIMIPIRDNALVEAERRFKVELKSPINALLGKPTLAQVIITDNDTWPQVRFNQVRYEVAEHEGRVVIQVYLTQPASVTATVNYRTLDGTAQAGQDYMNVLGTLSFNPGQTQSQIVVSILPDLLVESTESFILQLEQPMNLNLGIPNVALIAITDN